jgi:hypothetical protein
MATVEPETTPKEIAHFIPKEIEAFLNRSSTCL